MPVYPKDGVFSSPDAKTIQLIVNDNLDRRVTHMNMPNFEVEKCDLQEAIFDTNVLLEALITSKKYHLVVSEGNKRRRMLAEQTILEHLKLLLENTRIEEQ